MKLHSACVLSVKDGKILALLEPHKNRGWTLPGGKVERGETGRDAASRELREETGLYCPADQLIHLHSSKSHANYPGDCACYAAPPGSLTATHETAPTGESPEIEIAWVDPMVLLFDSKYRDYYLRVISHARENGFLQDTARDAGNLVKKSRSDFDVYSDRARSYAFYPKRGNNIEYTAIGLAEEVGEALGKIKKMIRDKGGVMIFDCRTSIKKDLGDALWYLDAMAFEAGLTLQEIADGNIEKLSDRKSRNALQGSGDDR